MVNAAPMEAVGAAKNRAVRNLVRVKEVNAKPMEAAITAMCRAAGRQVKAQGVSAQPTGMDDSEMKCAA